MLTNLRWRDIPPHHSRQARSMLMLCMLLKMMVSQGVQAAVVTGQTASLNVTYTAQHSGYHINYPADWKLHDHGQGVVVFAHATKAGRMTVNIQTIYTKAAGGTYPSIKALMDDFVQQVPRHTEDAHLFERSAFTLPQPDNVNLVGEQIKVTFRQERQVYKQWQVMLTSRNGELFQAWAYRAPEAEYAENLPIAAAMLASWVID